MNKSNYDLITRGLDIFFSGIALIFLSPILVPIAILLKFTGEGEVFYFQERIGRNEKTFKLIKFATMLKNSANIGTGELTLANDERVLPIGRFLRKTKINELAQLINIFLGDMSVIGPRPQTSKYYYQYSEDDRVLISKVKPGLSGIGSIIFRDEESILEKIENPLEFDYEIITPYKGKLEKWFVENRNILIYFQLIFLTVLAVVFSDKNFYKSWLKNLPKPSKELAKYLD